MPKHKFKIDDIVEVINYGLLVYKSKNEQLPISREVYNSDDEGYCYDIFPHLVGEVGQIQEIVGDKYLVTTPGDPQEYYEDQLKKI